MWWRGVAVRTSCGVGGGAARDPGSGSGGGDHCSCAAAVARSAAHAAVAAAAAGGALQVDGVAARRATRESGSASHDGGQHSLVGGEAVESADRVRRVVDHHRRAVVAVRHRRAVVAVPSGILRDDVAAARQACSRLAAVLLPSSRREDDDVAVAVDAVVAVAQRYYMFANAGMTRHTVADEVVAAGSVWMGQDGADAAAATTDSMMRIRGAIRGTRGAHRSPHANEQKRLCDRVHRNWAAVRCGR